MLCVSDRRANIGGAVCHQLHVYGFRQAGNQRRQHGTNVIGRGDNVGTGLALHIQHDSRFTIRPGSQPAVFCALIDGRHVGQPHRGAIFITDDQLAIILHGFHLIIGGKGDRAGRAIQAAFRGVNVSIRDGRTYRFTGQPHSGQRLGVHFHAHGGTLTARQRDQTNARDLGYFLCHARFHHILHLG